MRFLCVLLPILVLAPLGAQAMCWDAPCVPPSGCCICPCPNLIGAASLDAPSDKDMPRVAEWLLAEEGAGKASGLRSREDFHAGPLRTSRMLAEPELPWGGKP
jgi:hypothetical protein